MSVFGITPATVNPYAAPVTAAQQPAVASVPFGTPIGAAHPATTGAALVGRSPLRERVSSAIRHALQAVGLSHATVVPQRAGSPRTVTLALRRGEVARPHPPLNGVGPQSVARPAIVTTTGIRPVPATGVTAAQGHPQLAVPGVISPGSPTLPGFGAMGAYGLGNAFGAYGSPYGAFGSPFGGFGMNGLGTGGLFGSTGSATGPQANITNQGGIGAAGTAAGSQTVTNNNTFHSRTPFGSWGDVNGWGPAALNTGYGISPWEVPGPSMTGAWYTGARGGVSGFFSRLFGS